MGIIARETNTEPIYTVYIQDFPDSDYHKTRDEALMDDLERRARKLRRRYRNIIEYNDAMETYREYMFALSIKTCGYGKKNHERFLMMLELEQVDAYIPGEPKLKNTRLNRELMKKGEVITRGTGKILDNDELDEFIKEFVADMGYPDKDAPCTEEPIPIPKKELKMLDKIIPTIGESDFLRENKARLSEIDYLDEYFKARKIMSEKKSKKKKYEEDDEDELTLCDWYYGRYEFDEPDDSQTQVWYEGSIVQKDEIESIQILRQMKEYGWNPVKILTGPGVSEKGIKKAKESNDGSGDSRIANILKKQEKLEKKRKKKKKKNDDFFAKIMSDNKWDDFEDFENEMLNPPPFDNFGDSFFGMN